tara:strand:- start:350 stop:622 length:273 start_codon:yes stop_codon:yes gene_type:complete
MTVSQEQWAHSVLHDDHQDYVITPKLAKGLQGLGIEVNTKKMDAQSMHAELCKVAEQLEPMMDKNDSDFKELLGLLHGNNPNIKAADKTA